MGIQQTVTSALAEPVCHHSLCEGQLSRDAQVHELGEDYHLQNAYYIDSGED